MVSVFVSKGVQIWEFRIVGVVLVTTPQLAALQVTKRGAVMYKMLHIPLIGMVENMSFVKCPSCLNEVKVFGSGTQDLANELQIEVLQSFSVDSSISEGSDKGAPIVLDSNNIQAALFKTLAGKIVTFLNSAKKQVVGS